MAQTTRNAIRNGFLELLEQRPLDKISVVDIAEHCGVNRNTFYYYYPRGAGNGAGQRSPHPATLP